MWPFSNVRISELFSNIFTAHTAAHLQPPPPSALASTSSSSTMVIKTEVCAFSDTRIYPGHGMRFVRRDGQVMAQLFRTSELRSIVFDPGGVQHRTGRRVGFWWAVHAEKGGMRWSGCCAVREMPRKTFRMRDERSNDLLLMFQWGLVVRSLGGFVGCCPPKIYLVYGRRCCPELSR